MSAVASARSEPEVAERAGIWTCKVCRLPNAPGRVDCTTCRTLAPGRVVANVAEDEAFRPAAALRVWLLIVGIFVTGTLLASRVEFIYRWGGSLPSQVGGGYMAADAREALFRSAGTLKSAARNMRAGNAGSAADVRILRLAADDIVAVGHGGSPELVAAAGELRVCVDELASLRAAIGSGMSQELRWREAGRIERRISHAEEILVQ